MSKPQKKIVREFFLRQDEQSGHHGVMEKTTIDKSVDNGIGKDIREKKIVTPRGTWLLLPEKNLAQRVLGEYQSLPIDKRYFSPLAMTIIDNIAPRRADYDAAFLSSLQHDTILFVDDNKKELLRHLTTTWQPLWHWAADYFGAPLPIVHGLHPPALAPAIIAAAKKNIDAWDDWFAGGVFYLSTLLQSPIIALFAVHHNILPHQLFAHGFAEQIYQEQQWGIDAVAQEKKSATIMEIEKTQEFLKLMAKK